MKSIKIIFLMKITKILILVVSLTGSCCGQCNGPPLLLMPNNSTGSLAFPEANLDLMSGTWLADNLYPTNVNCTWILKAPPAHVINMKFLNFHTEEKFDYVTIYSSEDRNNGTGLFQFSGKLPELWETITPDNSLILDFVSDKYTTFTGFQLAYRYMPKACVPGGVVIHESQLIALPPWNLQGALPGPVKSEFTPMIINDEITHYGQGSHQKFQWIHVSNYPQGLNCTWQFTVDTRDVIEINFLRFQTNPSDFVQIWKIEKEKITPFLKFWEGKQPENKIISSSPLVINFMSAYGDENVGSGFLINITYSSRACSLEAEEISSPRGYVAYPKRNFESKFWAKINPIPYGRDNCTWILNAPKGYVINITIQEMDTRPEDIIEIWDNKMEMFSYEGFVPINQSIISNSNLLKIIFKSASESKNSGFLLHYSWILKECTYELDPNGGEIRSPYYPDTYGEEINCQWILQAETNQHVVHFVALRLKIDDGDFLQISDGNENILLTSSFQKISTVEFSLALPIVVNFLSDATSNRGYFYFKYIVFESGNCDFSLTTCGWKSTDRLHGWVLDEKNGIVFNKESDTKILPRGYKSKLVSPILNPGFLLVEDAMFSSTASMCLEFNYLISGRDAYQLNVAVESKRNQLDEVWNEESIRIFEIDGPYGNKFLWAAINFTVSGYFRVIFTYERGYGSNYMTALDFVSVKNGPCVGKNIPDLFAFSCYFNKSFCGWKNTHSDHYNWQLGNDGLRTVENISLTSGATSLLTDKRNDGQFADLLSPDLNFSNIFNISDTSLQNDACLLMKYQIFSPIAILKVLVDHSKGNLNTVHSSEIMLWAGGKFTSDKILAAEIPLKKDFLPKNFQIKIRAITTNPPKFMKKEISDGVLLRSVELKRGTCSGEEHCSFTNGFCSWIARSVGFAAWYIKSEENNNSIATVSVGNEGDVAILTSPQLKIKKGQSLKFRYKMNSMQKQCLQIGIIKGNLAKENDFNDDNSDFIVLWKQCRNKGNHWLDECVSLPDTKGYSQIFISVNFTEDFSFAPNTCLDDLHISSNDCLDSKDLISWKCLPEGSLCGLTQSSVGLWQWLYVEHKEKSHNNENMPIFSCLNGDIISTNYICNGYADCKDAEDEINCTFADYPEFGKINDGYYPTNVTHLRCADGRELNTSWFCDGIVDCEDGSDEENCGCIGSQCSAMTSKSSTISYTCSEKQFRCISGVHCGITNCSHNFCIDNTFVCDGIYHCNSREDEVNCLMKPAYREEFAPKGDDARMECSGGLYIPDSFKCDGRKDCPLDGKDEVGCHHCGQSEFLCPTSGVCLPWPAVCDGDISIETCTDEDFCQTCPSGYFACDICINSHQICDGILDCLEGEDETRCQSNSLMSLPMHDSPMPGIHLEGMNAQYNKQCLEDQYQCSTGNCIATNLRCNRILDCEDGGDEISCPEDNFEKTRFISAKSDLLDHTLGSTASYLTTPELSLENNFYGVLSFQYRLDSWIGPSNISLCIDIISASGNESLLPSSLWRQSGHKGKLWIKEKIIIPKMDKQFRISFIIAGIGVRHDSEKINLADISFKPVSHEDAKNIAQKKECNFDDYWCGWNQAHVTNGYAWVLTRTSPHARRTGPLAGYSGGQTSAFLLADSLHGNAGDTADLTSPALLFPKESKFICLRLMIFLFGTDVIGVSFHTQQMFSGHVFSMQIKNISGSYGLNWVPVFVEVTRDHLTDPDEPFVLAIRATRGMGPQSDVAIDQIKFSAGNCTSHGDNASIFLDSVPKHTEMFIIKAGPPFRPYVINQNLLERNSTDVFEEYCSAFRHCSSCVSANITLCAWCSEGHFCIWHNSPRARICGQNWLISDNKKLDSTAGTDFCPRVISHNKNNIFIPNNSSPMIQFSVENIQKFQNSDWLCRYSVPIGQSDLSLTFLENLKSPDADSELWKMLKGFAMEEKVTHHKTESIEVSGYFQNLTAEVNNTYKSGIVTCGNGQSSLIVADGESTAIINVTIFTPQGNKLDNEDNVQVTIYNCKNLAVSCEECVSLNVSFDCGWCSLSHKCLLSSECPHGKWNSHQNKTVCRIRDDLDILTELLSATEEDSENYFDDPVMDTEFSEFLKVSNVKKKVGKNLRKSLQTRKERRTKFDKIEVTKNKRKNKDSKGKSDKTKKSYVSKRKDKVSKKGRRKTFLKVPLDSSVYIARNIWRLHTGKQYYIPVKKKTLLNLGFVRQVNYGDMNNEKPRTVLIDGKWKKAVGFFVDLFENADDDPVTSIITTKESIFDKLLAQL